jgi:hypothetical protein
MRALAAAASRLHSGLVQQQQQLRDTAAAAIAGAAACCFSGLHTWGQQAQTSADVMVAQQLAAQQLAASSWPPLQPQICSASLALLQQQQQQPLADCVHSALEAASSRHPTVQQQHRQQWHGDTNAAVLSWLRGWRTPPQSPAVAVDGTATTTGSCSSSVTSTVIIMPGLAVTLPLPLPQQPQPSQQQLPETEQLPGLPQQQGVPLLCIKRTYQPNTQRYKRKHGFLRRCVCACMCSCVFVCVERGRQVGTRCRS